MKFLLTLNLVISHWKPTNSGSLVRVTRLFVFFACESDRRGHFSSLKSQTRLYHFLLFTIEKEKIGFLRFKILKQQSKDLAEIIQKLIKTLRYVEFFVVSRHLFLLTKNC